MKFPSREHIPKFSLKGFGKFAKLLFGKELIEDSCDLELTDDSGKMHVFSDYYNKNIKHHVQDFERDRIKALSTLKSRSYKGLLAGIAILAVSIIFLLSYIPSNPANQFDDVVFFLNLMAYSFLTAWCYMPVIKYKSSVKSIIFPKIFHYFGQHFMYSEESSLNIKDLEKSHIIPSHDNYTLEDYVKGAHNGIDLELTESRFTETRGSGENRRTVTVFHGLLIKLSMNKKFAGQTVLKQDKGGILNFLSGSIKGMEKVKLEDPVFEKMFEVHSTDQVEARYILTVTFMERLLKLADLYSKKIECSFYDEMLVMKIAVDHDLFETSSIFVPATFEHDIKTILKEMEQIFAIIDILKLNMKTGL